MINEDKKLAIEYLEKMKEDYVEGEGYERYPLAEWYVLDDVIKWLEQEPCNDCVSRVDLINKLGIIDKMYGSDFYWEMRKIVDSLPPVTPARSTDDKYKEVAMDLLAKYLESEQSLIAEYSGNFEESAMTLKKQTMKYLEKLGEDENAFYKLIKGQWIADLLREESEESEDE